MRMCKAQQSLGGPHQSQGQSSQDTSAAFKGKAARQGTQTQGWASELLQVEEPEPAHSPRPYAWQLWPHSLLLCGCDKRSDPASNKAWKQFFFLTPRVQPIANTEQPWNSSKVKTGNLQKDQASYLLWNWSLSYIRDFSPFYPLSHIALIFLLIKMLCWFNSVTVFCEKLKIALLSLARTVVTWN